MSTYKRARSAVTGRFVRLLYAARHPLRTVVETVKRDDKKPPERP